MLDEKKIEKLIGELLKEIDPEPNRPGLIETPKRAAKYYTELFEGAKYTNKEIAEMFDKQFEIGSDDLVIVRNITAFSHCEHHLALMYDGLITIAYLPNNGKVLGLSKFARIVELVCKRLQLQEKIVKDISEVLTYLGIKDHMVIMDNTKHGCMTARGIKNYSCDTRAQRTTGQFRINPKLEDKVLMSINNN